MEFDTATLRQLMPFAEVLGLELISADPTEVTGTLAWRPDLCTSAGVLHGGVVMACADTLGAMCAFLNLPEGANTSTIESKTNFFRASRGGRIEARSTPLHVGRTTIVVQTDLTNEEGKRLALVTQTQAVLRSERP